MFNNFMSKKKQNKTKNTLVFCAVKTRITKYISGTNSRAWCNSVCHFSKKYSVTKTYPKHIQQDFALQYIFYR